MIKFSYYIALLGGVLATSLFSANAEELDARSYTNIPINQNFFALAYGYSDGELYTSADVPLDDVELTLDGELIAYAHTFSLFEKSAKFDINTGHFCGDASAIADDGSELHRSFCGITDTRMRLTYNFYGAPALSLPEYIKKPKEIVVGASLQVSMPTGKYESKYILNTGANRWYFKPEIGLSIPWGKWEFDASLGIKFFTKNKDFKGSQTYKQDPIYNLQLHVIYDITRGSWIAFDTNYFGGGDTYLDGEKSGVKKSNHRAGITYSMSLSPVQSLRFVASKGVTTRLGNDTDSYAISWVYRWN